MIEIFFGIAFILCAKSLQVSASQREQLEKAKKDALKRIKIYQNAVWHIVITSEHENDNTELRRYQEAKEMIEKYNQNDVKVFLCVYRENDIFETWQDYILRRDQFIELKIRERQKLFSKAENKEFYLKYVLNKI